MAINKRKVLDSARKCVQRGAKQKALKEYDRLLRLDPRDGKLRLELGDVHRRWGQIEEATIQYTNAAGQYKRDGFDARAVAVYKQVLNLDPKRYEAYVSLAELYQRMGLDSEALGALQAAADGYHREGKRREAVELLRKMGTLDPSNTTSRIKVADLLQQEGMTEEAIAEYEGLLEEFEHQELFESIPPVLTRILEIQPERLDATIAMSRALIRLGQLDQAETYARQAVERAPHQTEPFELLCDIYKALERDGDLTVASRSLARIYREGGQEDRAREILQRCPTTEDFDPNPDAPEILLGVASGESQVDEPLLGDNEVLGDDFLVIEDDPDPDAADIGEEPLIDPLPSPEIDPLPSPEQWEPEAAEPQEEAVSEPPPPLPPATGEPDQLFAEASVYLRYGKRDLAIASLQGILEQEPAHRAALEKLGEALIEDGQTEPAVDAWSRAARHALRDGDTTACEVLCDRIAALDPDAALAILPPSDGAGSIGEPDLGLHIAEADDDAPDLESGTPSGLDFEIEIEAGGSDATEDFSAASSGAGASSMVPEQIGEQLEEAEFFFQQGLMDEAEAIYERVLALAPHHPSALLRIGEIAAARGANLSPGAIRPSDVEVFEWKEEFALEDEGGALSTPTLEDLLESEPLLEVDTDLLSSDLLDAEKGPAEESTLPLGQSEAPPLSADPEDSFDLAAELRDALDDEAGDEEEIATPVPETSTVEDGFRAIFREFKRGVSASLSDADLETRYDLGIAYREMALFEDAIAEFSVCLASPARRLDSLCLMALCALDMGRPADAISHFEQALAGDKLAEEVRAGITYDLARALEAAGDLERARFAYQSVAEVDPDFKAVSERIAALDANAAGADVLAPSEETFESFDDLLTEVSDVLAEGDGEEVEARGGTGRKRISFV